MQTVNISEKTHNRDRCMMVTVHNWEYEVKYLTLICLKSIMFVSSSVDMK